MPGSASGNRLLPKFRQQGFDREAIGYLIEHGAQVEAFTPATHRDRVWWAVETARVGSDWPGVLALHSEVIESWRARNRQMSAT
jgi:hypothetical protein